jgi:hypothetical protein
MGDEASPAISNLFLYVKEKQFVNRKVAELGEQEVIRRFHGYRFVLRYIDDRVAPNYAPGALPDADDYGLHIVDTAVGRSVVFLGIEASVADGAVAFKARDKQHSFTFPIVRFPSWHSTVPACIRVGTVIGMLVRTLRLTSKLDDFLDESTFLFALFQRRSYPSKDMRAAVMSSLRATSTRAGQTTFAGS